MITLLPFLIAAIEEDLRLQAAFEETVRQREAKKKENEKHCFGNSFGFRHTPTRVRPQRPQLHTTPQPEDEKIFGVNVRVDEPRAQDYDSFRKFIEDHRKFDDLVEAAERCTWQNKSNTAPLHKVNAFRRRLEDGPVIGKDLIGETDWWW